MENIMMLPASYCVMNEEEMTYTTGGASAIQAIAAWVFPPYAWLAGVTAIRDYRKKNPNTWTQDGLDYFANDMGKSVSNFLYDLACASWVLGTSATGIGLVINAAIVLLNKSGDSKEQQRRRLFPQGKGRRPLFICPYKSRGTRTGCLCLFMDVLI